MGPKVDNIYTVGDHKIAFLCVNKLEKKGKWLLWKCMMSQKAKSLFIKLKYKKFQALISKRDVLIQKD